MQRALISGLVAMGLAAATRPALAQGASAPRMATAIPPSNLEVTLDAVPLLVAHQSLAMARAQVLEWRYADAVASLAMVVRALRVFEREETGPNGSDADYTAGQISDYARVIDVDHSDAVSRIDDWTSRVAQWDHAK